MHSFVVDRVGQGKLQFYQDVGKLGTIWGLGKSNGKMRIAHTCFCVKNYCDIIMLARIVRHLKGVS